MSNIIRQIGMNLIIAMTLLGPVLYAQDLDWLHDYDQALIQAKKDKKDVYLFIGADKCRFCKKFKETTLADKDIIKQLEKDYVLVYLSRDQHKIPSWFETKGVPRHYFLSSDGEVFHETWGGREVKGFYDVLDEAELKKEW